MAADAATLVGSDGAFELTIVDDSAPGVFLPVTTVVRGQMSGAALRLYSKAERNMSAEQLDHLLRSAVMLGRKRVGAKGCPINVTMTDFR